MDMTLDLRAAWLDATRCMMLSLCSTVQLDDDLMSNTEARVRNRTFRAGLARPKPDGPRIRPFRQKTFTTAGAEGQVDMALALAARLGDEETARMLFPRMKSLISTS